MTQNNQSSDKRFRCDILGCSKPFKTKYSLKRHMKIHKVNKEWVCDKCNRRFALQQYLVEHDFTHTRQKPFQCKIDGCTETFRQRGKRSIHQNLVHGTGKRRRVESENGDDEPKNSQPQIGFYGDEELPTAKLLNDEQQIISNNTHFESFQTWLKNKKGDLANLNNNCKEILLKAILANNASQKQEPTSNNFLGTQINENSFQELLKS